MQTTCVTNCPSSWISSSPDTVKCVSLDSTWDVTRVDGHTLANPNTVSRSVMRFRFANVSAATTFASEVNRNCVIVNSAYGCGDGAERPPRVDVPRTLIVNGLALPNDLQNVASVAWRTSRDTTPRPDT